MTGRNPDGTQDFPSPGCSDVAYGPQRLNALGGELSATGWTPAGCPCRLAGCPGAPYQTLEYV